MTERVKGGNSMKFAEVIQVLLVNSFYQDALIKFNRVQQTLYNMDIFFLKYYGKLVEMTDINFTIDILKSLKLIKRITLERIIEVHTLNA